MTIGDTLNSITMLYKMIDIQDRKNVRICRFIMRECESQLVDGRLMSDQYEPSSITRTLVEDTRFEFVLRPERPSWITTDKYKNGVDELRTWMDKHPTRCSLLEWRIVDELWRWCGQRKHLVSEYTIRKRLRQEVTNLRIIKKKVELRNVE